MHHLRRRGHRQSAAIPGLACYGRGGEWATVTDADADAGYPDPDAFAEGWTTRPPPAVVRSGSGGFRSGHAPIRLSRTRPCSTSALAVPFRSGP